MDAWPRMLLSPKLLNPQGVFRTLQKTLGPFNNIDLIDNILNNFYNQYSKIFNPIHIKCF